jgi:hypothetical protein
VIFVRGSQFLSVLRFQLLALGGLLLLQGVQGYGGGLAELGLGERLARDGSHGGRRGRCGGGGRGAKRAKR